MAAVKGLGARLVVENLIRLSGGPENLVIDMTPGVSLCPELDSVLQTAGGRPRALAVLDANLSPLEIYGRRLLDLVLDRIAAREPPHPPALMSLSDSPLATALPGHFLRNLVLVDLDVFAAGAAGPDLDPFEVREALLNPADEDLISSLFWPPLSQRLRRYIGDLAGDEIARLPDLASILSHQKRLRAKEASPGLEAPAAFFGLSREAY
jgi:hypothetical protein